DLPAPASAAPPTRVDPITIVAAAVGVAPKSPLAPSPPVDPIPGASFPSGVSARLRSVLSKHSSVFPPQLPAGIPPARFGMQLHIDTIPGANPPASSPYRLSPPEQQELRKQLRSLVDLGFIVPTTSPYAAPVFFVSNVGKRGATALLEPSISSGSGRNRLVYT